MKLVVGLGNPGATYRGTRHNVGFEVLDRLAERHRTAFDAAPVDALEARWRPEGDTVLLAKPLTFMNLSGAAVAGLCRFYRIDTSEVLIVCDDVNLPLGRVRVRATGSEGGHNGLRSVAQHLGTIDYARLRMGVGRGDERRDLADHVLSRFEPEEQTGVTSAIDRSADAVEDWVRHGTAYVMNTYNRAL
ncbi:MAG: aminoacyl-tRNA hydrolase [Acidobacteriota bacterium]